MKMIRILALAAIAAACSFAAFASDDDDDAKVWKRNRQTSFGFIAGSLTSEDNDMFGNGKVSSRFGFFYNQSNTYLLHKKAIGGVLKFGLDVTWCDLSYVNYENIHRWRYIPGTEPEGWEDSGWQIDNYGKNQIDAGVGIGVSANVAPLIHLDNGGRFLKCAVYGQFMPSYTALLLGEKGTDEIQLVHGFNPYVRVGLSVSWKLISLGYEYKFSSPKLKVAGFDEDDDYSHDSSDTSWSFNSSSSKFKIGMSRIYLTLRF